MSSKRVHDPETKRARVLSSAQELFIEHGYAGTSMSAIARHSGITQSMIHHYFGSKDELWQAVKKLTYGDYLAHQQQVLDQDAGDAAAFTQISLRSRFRFLQENPQLTKLLSWLQIMQDPYGMETNQEIGRQLLSWISRAQAEGHIRRDVQPENILAMALALTTYWFQTRHVIRNFADLDEADQDLADSRYFEEMLQVFMDGLFRSRETADSLNIPDSQEME